MSSPKKRHREADDDSKKYTLKEHGHLGGLLAGKIGDNRYVADYAIDNRAKCRDPNCKQRLPQGMLRLGKIPPAFKLGHSNRTQWYHLECLFRSFRRMCKHSRIIISVADIEGFEKIIPEDQERIQLCILKYSRSNNNPYDASIKSVEMKEHHSDAYMEQETCKNTSITNNFISQTVPINSSLFQTPQIPFPMLTAVNPISTGIPLFPLAHVMHQSPIVGSKLNNKISSNGPAEGNKGDFDKIMDAWWHDLLQLQQIQLEKLQQKDNILPSSKKDNASDQKEKYDAV